MLPQLPAPSCRTLVLGAPHPHQFERCRNSSSSASGETQQMMDRPTEPSPPCSHRRWMLLPTLSLPAMRDEGSSPDHLCTPVLSCTLSCPAVPCCLWVNGHIPYPGQILPRHSTKPSHTRHGPVTNPCQPKDTAILDPS